MNHSFVPVLLGLDLNAYSVALSFYETYGICSHAFGRYRCGITEHSRFVKTHIVKDMDDEKIGVAALLSFAFNNRDKTLILVVCSDLYMAVVEKTRNFLSSYYSFFIPPLSVYFEVSDKKRFYQSLDTFGISHPKSIYLDCNTFRENSVWQEDFTYPTVLKPSDSVSYYRNPFLGMQKVYFPKSKEETYEIASRIYSFGYDKGLLLQEYIEAEHSSTLTVLVGKDGDVKRAVLGQILLEETAPSARGNYAALLTEPLDEISYRLLDYCEKIGYCGIGNFDILYGKDGKPYVLEMNPRQGRSCDYLRGCGISISDFLVSEIRRMSFPVQLTYPSVYWHAVRHQTVRKFAINKELLQQSEHCRKNGFSFSPFHGTVDTYFHPIRSAYVGVHEKRRAAAFKNSVKIGGMA